MLKKSIEKYLNEDKYEIFEFNPLNEYINNLPNLNYNIIPFNDEKMKSYKRVDIKYPLSSTCIEFIKSTPRIELLFIKNYNSEHVINEEINFIHEITEEIDEYNNCIIHFISCENDNNIEIKKTETYYHNNEYLNQNDEVITISKEEFKKYYDESLKLLNPTDKDCDCVYNKEKLSELEKKFVTLSNIYLLAKNYQEKDKKTR